MTSDVQDMASNEAGQRRSDEERFRIVRRLVRQRWGAAALTVIGVLVAVVPVLTLIPASQGIFQQAEPEAPWALLFDFWHEQVEFRSTLRASLSVITLGLLALAALPAISSRASRTDNIHAHVDSQVGWQIAMIASCVLAGFSWLSIPMTLEEGRDLENWVGLLALPLAMVLVLATGSTYFNRQANIDHAKSIIRSLTESWQEADAEMSRVISRWRTLPQYLFYGGMGAWVATWLLLALFQTAWPMSSTVAVAFGAVLAVVAMEVVMLMRFALEPMVQGSFTSRMAFSVQLLVSLYFVFLFLAALLSASATNTTALTAIVASVWMVGLAIVLAWKPPTRFLRLRERYLRWRIRRAKTLRLNLETLRDFEG